jgi:hypothetical protein
MGAYLWLRYYLFGNAVREVSSPCLQSLLSDNTFTLKLMPAATCLGRDNSLAGGYDGTPGGGVRLVSVCFTSTYGLVIRRLIFFGAIWYAITIAPMVVTYSSARHLYLISAGLSIAFASLIFPGRLRAETPWAAGRIVAATALLVLYGLALRWNVERWIVNGVESHRFVSALPSLLRPVPRGRIVLIDIPETNRAAWFWSWGLPFALEQPFVGEDLTRSFDRGTPRRILLPAEPVVDGQTDTAHLTLQLCSPVRSDGHSAGAPITWVSHTGNARSEWPRTTDED